MNGKSRAFIRFSLWLLNYKKALTALDILCNALIFSYYAAVAYCIRQILNLLDGLPGDALTSALPWLGGIAAATVIRIFAIQSCARLDARREYHYKRRVRGRILSRLLARRDVTTVSGQSGALFEVLDDDVPAATYPSELLTEVTGHFIFTLISLSMLLSINWKLTLFIFVPLSAAIFGVQRLSQRMKDRRRVSRDAHDAASTFIGDVASSAISIKASGAADAVLGKLDGINAARRRAVISDAWLGARVSLLLDGSVCVGSAVMMYIAAYLMAGARFGIGDFSLFIAHLGTLANCVLRIVELVTESKKAEVSLERITASAGCEIWSADFDGAENPGHTARALATNTPYAHEGAGEAARLEARDIHYAHEGAGEAARLEARDISYTYDGVGGFAHISFEVGPGEMLAVAGGMASGKSTLLSVLMGLMPPQSGEIRIRGGVSGAPQHGGFFLGDLRANILLGITADDKRIYDIMETTLLTEVANTAEGLSRNIGDQGARLSGGQRQRLALARALIRESGVYAVDDCVSGLDVATRARLVKNLRAFLARTGGSMVIATNSCEVLKSADRVLFMDSGRVACIGKYDELIIKSPAFSAAVNAG